MITWRAGCGRLWRGDRRRWGWRDTCWGRGVRPVKDRRGCGGSRTDISVSTSAVFVARAITVVRGFINSCHCRGGGSIRGRPGWVEGTHGRAPAGSAGGFPPPPRRGGGRYTNSGQSRGQCAQRGFREISGILGCTAFPERRAAGSHEPRRLVVREIGPDRGVKDGAFARFGAAGGLSLGMVGATIMVAGAGCLLGAWVAARLRSVRLSNSIH